MCQRNIVFWCFVLLIVASSSKCQRNSTNDNKRNDNSTVRYDPFVGSVKYQNNEMSPMQCDSCENSINNDEKVYNESYVNSTKNDCKNDDSMQYESREHIKNHEQNNQTFMEPCANFTDINDFILQNINGNFTKTEGENESTSNEFKNSNTDEYNDIKVTIVPYEECDDITCIQLCCPFGNVLTVQGKCVAGQDIYYFPAVSTFGNNSENKKLNELFPLTVRDPCVVQEVGRSLLNPYIYGYLINGSVYSLFEPGIFLSPMSYCLAILNRKIYDVIICTKQTKMPIYISACFLISLPFLLLTFVVYSILPELQNMHGYTLRAHIASLFITYAIMYVDQQISGLVEWKYCVPLAYIFNFSFLSSYFWLNVTCFDIWWTFRKLRSHQSSIKQDKKKLVMYSLYAWGITFILNIICAIMDYVPEIPESLIRPKMCKFKFWFSNEARMLYFYIPMGITIISNICFFIATTLTIWCQKIRTAHHLRDSESQRHNENKQRFGMYLKLFIVMGISWITELMAWLINVDHIPAAVWYPSYIINSLQGVIIFIIFVCRKKIKLLLLKRFDGYNCGPFCKISTNNDSVTNTISTSGSGTLNMQEISSSN